MKKFVNYYLLFKVPPSAGTEELRRAYIKLAQLYHPDKNKGSSLAQKKFRQVLQAWEVLKDPKKRSLFDKELERRRALEKASLSAFPKPKPALVQEKGIDLEHVLELSIEDICQSRMKTIHYLKPIHGKEKQASFNFQIPLGARGGTKLKFVGEGGAKGLKSFGDLYVQLSLKTHELFHLEKDSSDVLLLQPVSFVSALTAKELETISPYGLLSLKVHPPLREKQTLKIKDHGLVKNSRGDKGDLYIKIFIDYSSTDSVKVKERLNSLSCEKQKRYAEDMKKKSLVYPELIKFQKKVQKLKEKYYSE